jgi:hypothetical protein
MWAGIKSSGFSARIIWERRVKVPDLDLTEGGGTLASVWSYGEALALAGSHH